MKKNRKVLFSILTILVFIGSILFWYNKKQTILPQNVPVKVQVIRVQKAPLPEVIDTVGHLIPVQDVMLRAGVAGRIQTLDVLAGSRVEKGQRIVTVIPHAEVRAPFSGYVADWKIKVGEQVAAGTPLIELVNTEKFLVEYRLPEQYAGKLKTGQKIVLRINHSLELEGQVQFISPIIDKKSYTVLLKAEVSNTKEALWPGMSVHIRHILSENKEALVVPESCLIPTLEGYEIYKVVLGKLVKEKVPVGNRMKGRVQILSGVLEKDEIVIVHTPMLREGLDVYTVEWKGRW